MVKSLNSKLFGCFAHVRALDGASGDSTFRAIEIADVGPEQIDVMVVLFQLS